MRRKFILMLATNLIEPPAPPPPPRDKVRLQSSHRGPGAKHGKADPEMVRQLVLSLTQHTLLESGKTIWAGFSLTPYVALLPKEVFDDPAKN